MTKYSIVDVVSEIGPAARGVRGNRFADVILPSEWCLVVRQLTNPSDAMSETDSGSRSITIKIRKVSHWHVPFTVGDGGVGALHREPQQITEAPNGTACMLYAKNL